MTSTVKLFRDDAYLQFCEAEVVEISDNGIVLDQTVFYPTGGGQPGDTGRLIFSAGPVLNVTDTRIDADNKIFHLTDTSIDISLLGARIKAEIDWERRYAHMRMHTALHLLGAVLPYGVTGGSIGAERSRLDFDMSETVDKESVAEKLNSLVSEDYEVLTRWISGEELAAQPELIRTMSVKPPVNADRIRLLEIPGIDLQPCGGTHVARTGEIGRLRLGKVAKKGARNRRVNILFD